MSEAEKETNPSTTNVAETNSQAQSSTNRNETIPSIS